MSDGTDQWQVLGLLSAVGIAIGSVMPWAELQVLGFSGSSSGVDIGYGFLTILVAVVIGWSFVFDSWDNRHRMVVTVCAVVTLALSGWLIADQMPMLAPENTDFTAEELETIASVGNGLYVAFAGGVVSLFAAWQKDVDDGPSHPDVY